MQRPSDIQAEASSNDVGADVTFAGTKIHHSIRVLLVGLLVVVLAAGLYLSQRSSDAGNASRDVQADLLTHRDRGKACEPHGSYGNARPPRASHCDGDPGR